MKKTIIFHFSLLALVLLVSACSKKTLAPDAGNISAQSYAPTNPVLKRLSANATLRLLVNVPPGREATVYKKIRCTINNDALAMVQKIDVYMPGTESFSPTNLIASHTPASSTFEIPINKTLSIGYNYIWISVVLKSDAGISSPVEIHCTGIDDDGGKTIVPTEANYNYKKLSGSAVRIAGDDNVNTYRIPGIVQTAAGTLIAVYDIRYVSNVDLPGNIDVGMSRSTDGGKTWEPMRVIMDMGAPQDNNGVGDPAILFDNATNKIWVAALWSKGNRSIAGSIGGISPDSTGQFVLTSSSDDGLTWQDPYTITPQVKNPAWKIFFNGPGSGITMQDGKLVFAAQYWDENKMPFSTLIYSADHGANWVGKILGPKSNTTEAQVVETQPGKLMLNMRDNRGSFRSVATTTNMGTTWTEHTTSYSALPDPVCQGSLIKAKVKVAGTMKDVLFFSNPNTSSGRYNITIKASLDMGETWLSINQLLIDERNCYGYSSLVKIDENTIGILYEGVKDLYFVRVPVSSIIK